MNFFYGCDGNMAFFYTYAGFFYAFLDHDSQKHPIMSESAFLFYRYDGKHRMRRTAFTSADKFGSAVIFQYNNDYLLFPFVVSDLLVKEMGAAQVKSMGM